MVNDYFLCYKYSELHLIFIVIMEPFKLVDVIYKV